MAVDVRYRNFFIPRVVKNLKISPWEEKAHLPRAWKILKKKHIKRQLCLDWRKIELKFWCPMFILFLKFYRPYIYSLSIPDFRVIAIFNELWSILNYRHYKYIYQENESWQQLWGMNGQSSQDQPWNIILVWNKK